MIRFTLQNFLAATLAVVLFTSSLFADELTPIPRTVLINGGGHGSSVVFKEHNNKYYVLTSGHMYNGVGKKYRLQFFNKSSFVIQVLADYEKHEHDGKFSRGRDLMLLSFDKSLLGNHELIPVPLAPKGTKIDIGDTLLNIGFPEGSGPYSIHVTKIGGNSLMDRFTPKPFGGQSGSPMLMDVKNDHFLYGVLSWRTMKSNSRISDSTGAPIGYGGYVPLEAIHKFLEDRKELIDDKK